MITVPEFPFVGHEERLAIEDVLIKLRPKHCLEWGAGASTVYFPNKFKEFIKIWDAIEDNKEWYFALMKKDLPASVSIFHLSLPEYITYPTDKYDFIYMDGIERNNCMKYVYDKKLLRKNGILLLHDSGRAEYRPSYKYFMFNKELRPGVGIGKDGGCDFAGVTIFSNEPITI